MAWWVFENWSGTARWKALESTPRLLQKNDQQPNSNVISDDDEEDTNRMLASLLLTKETSFIEDSSRIIHQGRQLFELATPFDNRNQACRAQCDAHSYDAVTVEAAAAATATLNPFLDPCPACPVQDQYCGQQCRSCCQGGASSLKMQWHGCPGTFSLASARDFMNDCGGEEESFLNTTEEEAESPVRFVDCVCYDAMLRKYLNSNNDEPFTGCSLTTTHETLPEEEFAKHEICVVSVTRSDDTGANDTGGTTGLTVDLSKPLPDVIGIVLERKLLALDGSLREENTTQSVRIPTYIDTTCFGSPFVNPVFPGYGKFLHSCPHMAFVDLQLPGKPPLPSGLHHYTGYPPLEMFWLEFLDGTSVGFWPSEGSDDTVFSFHPTFAVCECQDCVSAPNSEPPTTSEPPTQEPRPSSPMPSIHNAATESPSASLPDNPSAKPSHEPSPSTTGDGCPSPQSTRCAHFALYNCLNRGTEAGLESLCLYGEEPAGRFLAGPLKDLLEGDTASFVQTVLELYDSGQISKDWVASEMNRHQKLLSELELQKIEA